MSKLYARQKGLIDTDNSVVIAGGEVAGGGGRGYKRDKWSWANTIKINY